MNAIDLLLAEQGNTSDDAVKLADFLAVANVALESEYASPQYDADKANALLAKMRAAATCLKRLEDRARRLATAPSAPRRIQ